MKVKWLGHSALLLEGSRSVLIDPFLTDNPSAVVSVEDIKKCDIVIVTHDHSDHLGDSFDICKKTGAVFISLFEISEAAAMDGISAEMMNVGGTVESCGVKVSMVPALHTAGLGGTAVGVVVEMDGKSVYHAGDTGLTMDMKLIGEMYSPDVAFLPIDGRFTMTPKLAAKAVELLKIPKVVPIHYNTFPAIESSPEEFRDHVNGKSEVIILKPGESLEL
ncbi:MAG: metal-dependent hydrolase [Acidobacteriota bacterium]